MGTFDGVLAGGSLSPKWLSFFQKGRPGDVGYYFGLQVGNTKKLYGPIKGEGYAYVLSSLVYNEPTSWPGQLTVRPSTGRGVGLYDSPEELTALVRFPEEYGYDAVKLLPTSQLKLLSINEDEAFSKLRIIDFVDSGWYHFFRFARPSDDGQLFPFAYTKS